MRGRIKLTKTEAALLAMTVLFFAVLGLESRRESPQGGNYEVTAERSDRSAAEQEVQTVERIDLNTASKEELVLLDGIGEALAERIIADREKNGEYETVEDVLRVDGIGEKTLEKFRDYVQVEGEP